MEKLELIRLELNGFGRFRGQAFELQGGLNLIEGAKAPDGLSMTLPIYVVIFIVIAVLLS